MAGGGGLGHLAEQSDFYECGRWLGVLWSHTAISFATSALAFLAGLSLSVNTLFLC